MDRRVLPLARAGSGQHWAALRAGFRWRIPAAFSIPDLCCDAWARHDPDRLALLDLSDGGEQRWTYGALKSASDRLANAMAARGVTRGDRVGVLLPQSAAVPVVHFAAQKLGAVALPLFTLFGPEALAFRLADSGASAVVTDGENIEKLLSVAPDLPALRTIWCTDPVAAPLRHLWSDIGAASCNLTPVPLRAQGRAACASLPDRASALDGTHA